jgi:hypothetical protein
MRLLIATAILAIFGLPLANAHIVICTFNEDTMRCEVDSIGDPNRPPHASIFEAPCFCFHTGSSMAMARAPSVLSGSLP